MNEPNVSSFSAIDKNGEAARFTISTEIIDYLESARTFGREDLSDPQADGRFQRRMIAIPDKRSAVVTPLVLTISNQGGLYLVRKDNDTATAGDGWSLIDLSSELQKIVGGSPRVRAFSAGWTDDDRIVVAVAIDDGATDRSRVFVAYDLSSRTTDWKHLPWKDCGVRENVRVEGIRVLDDGAGHWRVVLAGDRGPNDMLYLLDSELNQTFPQAVVFNPAVTLEEILDFEAVLHPTQGPGIAVLGINGGTRDLSLRPFPSPGIDVPPIVPLPCPAGANVLETGLTRQVGRSGRHRGSDLYIGGQGVQLIAAEQLYRQEEAEVIEVAAAEAAVEVQDLMTGEGPDGSTAVWARLQDGGLIVTKRHAGSEASWSTPLRLRGEVQVIAPVHGDVNATTSVLAVYSDGRAAFIWQDAGRTGIWQERPLLVANPQSAAKVTCYGTSLRLLDGDRIPQPGRTVTVSASALTSVVLNGKSVFIGPNLRAEATTDVNGGIHLYDRVRSLTPAIYRFSMAEFEESIDVNPAAGAHKRFQEINGDDLRNAKVPTPGGGSEPLLPPDFAAGGKDSRQVDAVAAALNHVAKLADSATGSSLPSGVARVSSQDGFSSKLRTAAVDPEFQLGIKATSAGLVALDDRAIRTLIDAGSGVERFFVDLGDSIVDFFEGLAHRIQEGWEFVLHKAEEGFRFVCRLGSQVRDFVLDTLEQVGGFFTWLWDQIKTGLDKVWEFLKFTFDWDDILLARDMMVRVTDEALLSAKESVDTLEAKTKTGFDYAIKTIRQWRSEIGVPPARLPHPAPGTSVSDEMKRATSSVGGLIDKITGNSVLGWVMDKAGGLADEIVHIEGPNPAEVGVQAAGDFLTGLVGDEIQNLMNTWNRIQADVLQVFGNKMPDLKDLSFDTIKNLFVAVGADLIVGLLEGIRDLILRSLDLLKDMVEVFRAALFARVSFPFIEKLVELVAPGAKIDTSFRLIDALMLLISIPATIAYKLIFQEAPFKKGQTLNLPLGRATVQSDAMADVKPFLLLSSGVLSMIVAGQKTFKAATGSTKGAKVVEALAIALLALGFMSELVTVHDPRQEHNGDSIAGMEAAGILIVGLMGLVTLKGQKIPDSDEAVSAVTIVGNVVLIVIGCAVFGVIIDYLRKSPVKYDEKRQWPESLRWLSRTFKQLGTILICSGVFVKDPKVKAIVISIGATSIGASFTMLISNIITQKFVADPVKPAPPS